MMEGPIQFHLLAVLLLLATINNAEAQKIPSHFKLGGPMVLKPPVSGAITSIVWKFKGNLVAEWTKGSVDLTIYGSFKGRTTLNTTNGVLEINSMSKEDIGEFVVEINNKVLPQRFEPVEIKDVPDPVVTVKPLACGPTSSDCNLVCDGNITGAGPVTFSWKMGDEEDWKESKQTMNIINDEKTKNVQKFYCRMKNPVSEKESKSERNPFIGGSEPSPPGGNVAGPVVGALVVLGIIIACVVGYVKRDVIMNLFRRSEEMKLEDVRTGGRDETTTPPTNETPLMKENAAT